jgi:hypothetical protein
MDFSTLVTAVDFGTVQTGILGVGAVLAGLYVATRGARLLLAFIRR